MSSRPARMTRYGCRWVLAVVGAAATAIVPCRAARADVHSGGAAAAGIDQPRKGTLTVVGTLVAVDVVEKTLVLDVPLAIEVLRVGATVPAKAELLVGTKRLSLQELRPGERIRLVLHRVPAGDEVISGVILRGAERPPVS